MKQPPPYLVSVRMAAELLGIGRKSVYRAIQQGYVPAVRLGVRGPVLIALDWIAAVSAGQTLEEARKSLRYPKLPEDNQDAGA